MHESVFSVVAIVSICLKNSTCACPALCSELQMGAKKQFKRNAAID